MRHQPDRWPQGDRRRDGQGRRTLLDVPHAGLVCLTVLREAGSERRQGCEAAEDAPHGPADQMVRRRRVRRLHHLRRMPQGQELPRRCRPGDQDWRGGCGTSETVAPRPNRLLLRHRRDGSGPHGVHGAAGLVGAGHAVHRLQREHLSPAISLLLIPKVSTCVSLALRTFWPR